MAEATPKTSNQAADTSAASAGSQGEIALSQSAFARLGALLQRHGVALISLCVALISLSYNTWRNETTESHRNTRAAGFRILLELGELQQIVDYTAYFQSASAHENPGNAGAGDALGQQWVRGWGKVALIRDLALLLPPANAAAGKALFEAWQSEAVALQQGIGVSTGAAAEASISAEIQRMREQTLSSLQQLD